MYADPGSLPMEMRLRPEQWVLLGILAAGLTILALQLGQDWTLPDLGSAPDGAPGAGAEERSAPPQAATAAAALRLRCEPETVRVGESFAVVVSLDAVGEAVEATFAATFDPETLAADPEPASPLTALTGPGGPPDLQISSPTPARLLVTLRRRDGEPRQNATGDLCKIQFTARRVGRTRLLLTGGTVLDAGGAHLTAPDAEIWIEVR